jgi:hypothetical protein
VLSRRGVSLDWRRRVMMVALAAPVLLYVIKIGGDARHFRYLAFPYCLLVCALGGIPEHVWQAFRLPAPRALLPAAGVLLGLITFLSTPRQLDRHPLRADVRHRMVDRITDAQLHRDRILPDFPDWAERVTPDILRDFAGSDRFDERWPVVANELCVENYVDFDRRIVHALGLTDAILARATVPADRPGHKNGLVWMSNWIAREARASRGPGPYLLSSAAEADSPPDWVVNNLDAIRLIERKVHNRHVFAENLRLAIRTPRRIAITTEDVRAMRR